MRKRSSGSSDLPDDGFKAVFRPILLLALTVFIDLLGFGIILPNLPLYIKQAVGEANGNAAFVGGLLAASYSLTQFLCAPFWGRYSDRAGRRPVILISLLGVGLAYIFFGLANDSLWMLFTARLLAGLLSSASIGVSFAYVADVTTPANRAKGMGLLGACFGLGFMFGPALGGILGKVSLSLPAYVAAGMALINFVFSYKFLPESLSAEERAKLNSPDRPSAWEQTRQALTGPNAGLYVLSFISIFGFAAIEQAFGFFLLARGIANDKNLPERFGYLMAFVGIIGIIIQGGLIGRMVSKLGEGKVARIGMGVLVLGYVALTLPREWGWMVFLPTIPLSGGRSMMGPAISALISRRTQGGQGLNLSVQQSFDALARTVGPLTAGWLFKTFDPTAPYYFSAGLTVFALLLTVAVPSILAAPKDPEQAK
jgi:DHA1 family multidrug resistance protein-like MFS transporter